MSKLFLDLKKFKKLKSDDKTTTFQHADGHTITVAHTKLTDAMRKQMDTLPLAKVEKELKKPGKEVQKLADGGEVAPNSDPGYMDYLKYLAQKGMDNVGNGQQQLQQQVQLAQQQAHNPNMQLTPEQQAQQQQYFQNVAGAVGGSIAPVKGAAIANDLANPSVERQAMNAAYEAIPQGYAPEAAEDIVRKTQQANRAADFAQRNANAAKTSTRPRMADGGPVADSADQIAQDAAAQAGTTPVEIPGQASEGVQSAPPSLAAFAKGVEDSSSPPSYSSPQEQLATQQALASAPPDQSAAPVGAPATSSQGTPPGASDELRSNMQKAYDMQLQSYDDAAKAKGDLGKNQSGILGKQTVAEADNLAKTQAAQQQAMTEYDGLIKDVQKGYVNPNHFMENMGTGQRVASAIGMLLGGLNGTPGGANPAMDFINKQIDRDIEAQKTNLGAKNNLLAHNIQHLNSVQDGYRLTQAQMAAMYAHQIDQEAAKAMGPQAQAAAMQAKGELLGKSAMFLGQIGGPGAGGAGSSIDNYLNTMRVVNPERAKEIESRYIPGMGVASVPLTPEVRGDLNSKSQFDSQLNRMIDWVKHNQGTVIDRAKVNEGKAMAAELAGLYRNASNGGVYKESEQNFINKLIPEDPSQFAGAVRTLPKLNELKTTNGLRLNMLKKSYGFSGLPGQSQNAASSGFQPKSFKPVK